MPAGLLASFDTPDALLSAVSGARAQGYRALDAYTPFPVEGLAERLALRRSRIPFYAFIGGALASGGILALQAYSTTIGYPINVGSRPLLSWTAFAIPAFECAILGAALVAFFGMLAGNRLPQFYHPVFNAGAFSMADENRFYLLVAADDPLFEADGVRRMLETFGPQSIELVPS